MPAAANPNSPAFGGQQVIINSAEVFQEVSCFVEQRQPPCAPASCLPLKTATERAGDRDQDASANEAGDQIANPTAERDAEEAQ